MAPSSTLRGEKRVNQILQAYIFGSFSSHQRDPLVHVIAYVAVFDRKHGQRRQKASTRTSAQLFLPGIQGKLIKNLKEGGK